MKCKNCKKEDKQIKAGKTRAGSQVYKCKHCGKTYTPKPKERKYSEEIKRQAIKLYMEGNSGRAVGRILGISKKYMLVLDKKIREKNRGEKGIKWASKGNRDGWVVHIHREKKTEFTW